jgi:transcriptional regulator with XRE-family HTH domain
MRKKRKEVEPIYKKVGKKVAALRKEKGWNQQYLADLSKNSFSGIRSIEQGKVRLSSLNIFLLAGVFGVAPSVLLEDVTIDDVQELLALEDDMEISF